MLSRLTALFIGTFALAALRGQFDALPYAPLGDRLWWMAGYFAVLTNLGMAGLMFAVARGWQMKGTPAAAMLAAVAIVAGAYPFPFWSISGPEPASWWADKALHLGVPLAVGLWWLGFADKRVNGAALSSLIAWPAVYCAYALGRGYLAGPEHALASGGDFLWFVQCVSGLAGYLLTFIVAGFSSGSA